MPKLKTPLQQKTFEIVQRTGKPVKHAMLEAGYKKSTAHTPQKLTNSRSWRELLNDKLPNEWVFKRHKYLLEKKDGLSIARGLDMYYKMTGKYQQDLNIENSIVILPTELVDKYNLKDGSAKRLGGGGEADGDSVDMVESEIVK